MREKKSKRTSRPRLPPEAEKARRPLPVEERGGVMQDKVHEDTGRGRAAVTTRNRRKAEENKIERMREEGYWVVCATAPYPGQNLEETPLSMPLGDMVLISTHEGRREAVQAAVRADLSPFPEGTEAQVLWPIKKKKSRFPSGMLGAQRRGRRRNPLNVAIGVGGLLLAEVEDLETLFLTLHPGEKPIEDLYGQEQGFAELLFRYGLLRYPCAFAALNCWCPPSVYMAMRGAMQARHCLAMLLALPWAFTGCRGWPPPYSWLRSHLNYHLRIGLRDQLVLLSALPGVNVSEDVIPYEKRYDFEEVKKEAQEMYREACWAAPGDTPGTFEICKLCKSVTCKRSEQGT